MYPLDGRTNKWQLYFYRAETVDKPYNIYMLERLICAFGIEPNTKVTDKIFKELILFTAKALRIGKLLRTIEFKIMSLLQKFF